MKQTLKRLPRTALALTMPTQAFAAQETEVCLPAIEIGPDSKRHHSGQLFRPVGIRQETMNAIGDGPGIEPDYRKSFFAADPPLFRRTDFCTPAGLLELEFDKLIEIGREQKRTRRVRYARGIPRGSRSGRSERRISDDG